MNLGFTKRWLHQEPPRPAGRPVGIDREANFSPSLGTVLAPGHDAFDSTSTILRQGVIGPVRPNNNVLDADAVPSLIMELVSYMSVLRQLPSISLRDADLRLLFRRGVDPVQRGVFVHLVPKYNGVRGRYY